MGKLIELGFDYDCSCHLQKPRDIIHSPFHCYLQAPQLFATPKGKLLLLPTTCSFGYWIKRLGKVGLGMMSYKLIYLHDYDLLSIRYYLSLQFLLFKKHDEFVTAETLAHQIRLKEETDYARR